MTPSDLSNVNDCAIQAKRQLLQRLDDLMIGAPLSQSFSLGQQRDAVRADLDLQLMIATRLAAAGVAVTPLDPQEVTRLNTLAQLVDAAITADDIRNADLATVSQLAAAAKGIGDILNRHA